mmetsp:Transcript_28036/g.47648  ORF Transcript_28036/g.47648 Transcript_28036/m.47648 type:complete len:397 (-) Transcript_28036:398-1588(-)|eukprot:CAMPEP_0183726778 /NCGR_PEP_ID=MMETSP0737-20130205/24161_1 /TAXON_ID=385413 /ORGANISM="Thalassiosira miniscula, Strain CCMP1093" /LENGTH=396 /DNA_ID=CAMNT_0025958221 /DNA_START=70 /DNA_END=1260 /DNA_ORIENTATION=+
MSNNKLKKRQARLFSTLASIEQTDRFATERRKQSHLHSLQQSRAAADQAKLNGILLELRILTQRCLAEEGNGIDDEGVGMGALDGSSRVKEEVDALLENLLVARRDLLGHQLDDAEEGDDATSDNEKKKVDYTNLIRQTKEGQDETTSSDSEGSTDSDSRLTSNDLTEQLQNEYSSLQNHWKTILNKYHSNLALHSGMSANSSKFQSKAVDVSFWEQVRGAMEHEQFKQRTSISNSNQMEVAQSSVLNSHLKFDDSKLYQQMLKDFISSSQTNGAATTTSKMNKRGMIMDPAQEAAERLKRAMRKKSGGAITAGDVDLASILTKTGTVSAAGMIPETNFTKKKTSTVDRRASKGRKIRYTVHPKLVNFTFPVGRAEPMISEDVWLKSLFGGVGNSR